MCASQIDVRGEYPYYLWRCLSACVDAVVSEYDAGSMGTQLRLLCPRCDEFVTRLDRQAASLPCHTCDYEADVTRLATPQLGVASSADDVCDGLLRQLLGHHRHTDAEAKGEEGDGRHESLLPDALLDLRRSVLASAAATVTRCGSLVRPPPHEAMRRHTEAGVIDNTHQPRCWLAVFNHDTDDSAGVTLHPVCEHPQHVHACVEAALRAAGIGVTPGDVTPLPCRGARLVVAGV